MSPFARHVTNLLLKRADPEVKAGSERYFKGAVPFRGVRGPGVQAAWKESRPMLRKAAPDDILALALELLASKYFEDKQFAVVLLHHARRTLPRDTIARLEPVFDRAVHDWATCDAVGGRVLRYLLLRSSAERHRVVAWSRSGNPWRQRASAVAFVNEARHGHLTADILSVCRRTVRNEERFVQLGTGWVLRELWLAAPEAVETFLQKHRSQISPEGLRYAVEKMPATLQRQIRGAARKVGGTPKHR